MTPYEILRTLAIPVFPALQGRVRRDLERLARRGPAGEPCRLLDVGGRSSPYTTGLPARITLLDVPRESEIQENLALGLDRRLLERVRRRRSNIERVVIEDMWRTTLDDGSFDGAVAVEVIEHVPDDRTFVEQMARVVRPGGWVYLTTPNGDWVKLEDTHNPDHLRHYTRDQLARLMGEVFDEVRVVYGIRTGKARWRGLRPFNPRRPIQLAATLGSNLISHWQSRGLDEVPRRTAHLIAVARKSDSSH